ncbi:hypothetical protein KP509_24G042300 [Ceratopteris richardii]|uniref:PHD and RING finger domain-containing protein 1 n=1 Tax=Ceratopteris richardii TaxID=49495 RepID=A0A8T2RWV7_CERRI|nr:hypothetical protein KP509_24G042300 [Ceratopteris richardii]
MPARARKRKSRKRKSSSRRRPSSRKRIRRAPPRPAKKETSSDEDFIVESECDESSSDSEATIDSDTDEGTQEEVEGEDDSDEANYDEDIDEGIKPEEPSRGISSSRVRSSARRPHNRKGRSNKRSRRLEVDCSDEEIGSSLRHDKTATNLQVNSRSSRMSLDRGGISSNGTNDDDDDFILDVIHPSSSNRSRKGRVRHDSSDEDFEIILGGLQNDTVRINDSVVANRPITRAMDPAQLHEFVQPEAIAKKEGLDAQSTDDSKTVTGSISKVTLVENDVESVGRDTTIKKDKGKEKMFEKKELRNDGVPDGDKEGTMAAVVCGICLSETSTTERGKLDSCDHFYCFGCIMEWAKVESRCPMCKQRFTAVSRAGGGISKRTRTIRIPTRDQVYIPEDDVPFVDPYEDVICMECQETCDEGLLLLCDRCDSAAHTYCVGLGRRVPHGDWYCRNCQPFIAEDSNLENEVDELVLASDESDDDDDDNVEEDEDALLRSIVASEVQPVRQRRVQSVPRSSSTRQSLSRRRMGAGRRIRFLRRRISARRGRNGRSIPLATHFSRSSRAFLSTLSPERNSSPSPSDVPSPGSARTVPYQRRLQERINAMRNNWGRIQNGELQFDAIRARTGSSANPSASANRASGSSSNHTPAAGSSINNRTLGPSESTSQDDKGLDLAWRMMSQARNLSAATNNNITGRSQNMSRSGPQSVSGQPQNFSLGISSVIHPRSPDFSHHFSNTSSRNESMQPLSTTFRTGSNLQCLGKSLEKPTEFLPSQFPQCNDNNGRNTVDAQQEAHSESGKTCAVSPPLATQNVDNRRQESFPPSNRSLSAVMDQESFPTCSRPLGADKNHPVSLLQEFNASTVHAENSCGREKAFAIQGSVSQGVSSGSLKRDSLSRAYESIGNQNVVPVHDENICGREKSSTTEGSNTQGANSSNLERGSSIRVPEVIRNVIDTDGAPNVQVRNPSQSISKKDLKIHLVELVKKEIWPLYIREGLGTFANKCAFLLQVPKLLL